jgi:hypothetical protein
MKGREGLLILTVVSWAAPAQSEWNMGKSLADLLIKTQPAQEEKERPARFKDNGDGTVTDSRSGLIWLKDADCVVFFAGDSQGLNSRSWRRAELAAGLLANGFCGLTDGSKPGGWRLPAREELLSIVEPNYESPALANTAGTGQWTENDPFVSVQSFFYWSSSEDKNQPDYAFYVNLAYGVDSYAFQLNTFHVWPVRGGQKEQQPK